MYDSDHPSRGEQNAAQIDYEPPAYRPGDDDVPLDPRKWMLSPLGGAVYFRVEQGLNRALVETAARFATVFERVPVVFAVTYRSGLQTSFVYHISYETGIVEIQISRETGVWNFEALFREIAVSITQQLNEDGEITQLPLNRLDAYVDGLPRDYWTH